MWANDLYKVIERTYRRQGGTVLTITRRDGSAGRDWRHFQAIKNEICGAEREGAELYPAESRLMDEANDFHIYVMPAGKKVPFGSMNRSVLDASDAAALNAVLEGTDRPRFAPQRDWQPGLPTGLGQHTEVEKGLLGDFSQKTKGPIFHRSVNPEGAVSPNG